MAVYNELEKLRDDYFDPLLKDDEVGKLLKARPVDGDRLMEKLLASLTICEATGKKVDVRAAVCRIANR